MVGSEHCQFFVKKKSRYCRMTVKKGKQYCGEHQSDHNDLSIMLDERVACPLDPRHTCYRSKLNKHLKVCNAKLKQDKQQPYIIKGINLNETAKFSTDIPLSQIEQVVIDSVLNKIKNAFEKLPPIPNKILKHKVLESELNNPTCGTEAKRHLLQTASLLGHLDHADLIGENTCFIEFGAGRGKLTYWLAQAIKGQRNSSILLVDRSSHRHKKDNKLKNEKFEIKVTRVCADIADLQLNNVPEVSKMQSKVAIAKHICGAATDLTLRCMTNSIEIGKNSKIGITIAFCCHHCCEYSQYVGHKYLESEGFTRDEFPILCKIASWATCGIRQNNEQEDSERETIGFKVKTLLNWGRLIYLKEFGFNCQLIYYTSTDVTLENMCIVATFIETNTN